MKWSARYNGLALTLCSSLFLGGCATYYKATDPQSGNEYFTQEVTTLRDGAVKLKDERTGSVVTLQSSEIKEISDDEYEASIAAKTEPAPSEAK